jgi:hypothetical protein
VCVCISIFSMYLFVRMSVYVGDNYTLKQDELKTLTRGELIMWGAPCMRLLDTLTINTTKV